MDRAILAVCLVVALIFGAAQTWRLARLADAPERLETCREVNRLEREARDATDDDLVDDLSDTR